MTTLPSATAITVTVYEIVLPITSQISITWPVVGSGHSRPGNYALWTCFSFHVNIFCFYNPIDANLWLVVCIQSQSLLPLSLVWLTECPHSHLSITSLHPPLFLKYMIIFTVQVIHSRPYLSYIVAMNTFHVSPLYLSSLPLPFTLSVTIPPPFPSPRPSLPLPDYSKKIKKIQHTLWKQGNNTAATKAFIDKRINKR